jgi:Ser/Thr protein kinase RdoA (MazF antagonist)
MSPLRKSSRTAQFSCHTLATTLKMDVLEEHVQRDYCSHGALTAVPRGRASNYAVSQNESRWLLKVFQPEYTRTRIERAADFVSFRRAGASAS